MIHRFAFRPLSTEAELILPPNRERRRRASPATWPQEEREEIYHHVAYDQQPTGILAQIAECAGENLD